MICILKGQVTKKICSDCFYLNRNLKLKYFSRVLCQKENITEKDVKNEIGITD